MARPDAELTLNWIKSMTISNFNITGASATAIVTFLDGYPKVRVTMITDGKGWKIDRVKNVPVK